MKIEGQHHIDVVISEVKHPQRERWGRHVACAVYHEGRHIKTSPSAFSLEGLRELLKPLVKSGVLDSDAAVKAESIATELSLPRELTRADRVTTSGRTDAQTLLEHIFGDSQPEQPARIELCDDDSGDVHLYAYDNVPMQEVVGAGLLQALLDLPREMTPTIKARSRQEAYDILEQGWTAGAVSDADRDRLRTEIGALELPETFEAKEGDSDGESSSDEPFDKFRANLDGLVNELANALRAKGVHVTVETIRIGGR